MRLLEFNKGEGGANPQRAGAHPQKRKPATQVTKVKPVTPSKPPRMPTRGAQVHNNTYPIQGNAIRKPLQRAPVDLELLQQRIGFLEKRLQDQSDKTEKLATIKDIDLLRERMNRMENNLEQALHRPPLKTLLKARAIQFWHRDRHLIAAWLLKMTRSAWREFQPEWWPQLARAWQESLDKARR